TYAFQPYFLNVLGQDSQKLTLMFIMFGTLSLLMQTQGIKFLTRNYTLTNIVLFAIFIRSASFILMPIWPNLSYFIAISIIFSIFNSLVQPLINTLISLNTKPEAQGMALGLNSSYLSISNAFGPVIAGMTIDRSHLATYGYALYLAGILTFLVLLLAIFTRKKYAIG
ncbi:MAG TPA: MFS transporter, partial [Cyanobacteria bacterium UBA11049]|nr:MFS transporter [Cyanobacteria bacterium UBA11049]